ncbi:MAG TPA: ATPase domain-containing protein [Chloroflexia bacterium]|nr:ATPase domain-containing protein [Chloroflexia bacterium]
MPTNTMTILPTGVEGLDTILGGGIPQGSLLMVVGAPGTGKTILLQQLCFAWGRRHRAPPAPAADPRGRALGAGKAIYFSTLSEPHDKLIEHISQFDFFDPGLLQEHVKLLSLISIMDKGLAAVGDVIIETARRDQARLVCLDSFAALATLAADSDELRRFLYRLSSQLRLLQMTVLVSLERTLGASSGSAVTEADLTVADGILGLYSRMVGAREYLRIEVRKLRGMARRPGLHTYALGPQGMTIYPRMESLVGPRLDFAGASRTADRLQLGLPELEQMLGGGLPRVSSTLVAGSPGTGKTLLSLHFLLAGVRQGEPGLYVGFQETAAELIGKAASFGLDLPGAVDGGQIQLLPLASVELEPDQVAAAIRAIVEAQGVRRVVLDSFAELERVCHVDGRSHDFVAALATYFKHHEVTALYTHEISKVIGPELDLSDTAFMAVAENLLLLRQVEYRNQLYRVLSILKMRASAYDARIREFTIRDAVGLTVLDSLQSAEGLLTGLARSLEPR